MARELRLTVSVPRHLPSLIDSVQHIAESAQENAILKRTRSAISISLRTLAKLGRLPVLYCTMYLCLFYRKCGCVDRGFGWL